MPDVRERPPYETDPGIHHVTAIASEPQANLDLYTQVLGLRLVTLTANYDDPGTYHLCFLYFGAHIGRLGTIVAFFPWPGTARGRTGAGQATATAFTVPAGAMAARASPGTATTWIPTPTTSQRWPKRST